MIVDDKLLLSDKYKAFLKCTAPVEFLEGTTAAGKTTVGTEKFMLKVYASPKKMHILSGLDLGTIEKNIINKDLGILDQFEGSVEYNAGGKGSYSLPHIAYQTSRGEKIVYVLGYDNKARWKKALGGQYGCLYIDEINIADMEYVREAAMRCDYLMGTLNPDDPNLPVYKEYINCSRPLPEWRNETPDEILDMLTEEPKPGWVHWFFSFTHNLGLPKEKIEQIIMNTPKGTKLYKNKIQGLRGKAAGLVFPHFDKKKHTLSKSIIKQRVMNGEIKFKKFSIGLDTAYSQQSPDTISMIFQGLTEDNVLYVLDERVYNNANLGVPIAPSDTVVNLVAFADRNRKEWGLCKDIFIDSADQATITEALKYKRNNPTCIYNFINAYKKTKIIDRILLQQGWIHLGYYMVARECAVHIGELESYSWKEDKDNEPEDRNDHTINASQYGWLPHKEEIGNGEVQI